jgi:hypothetical protein
MHTHIAQTEDDKMTTTPQEPEEPRCCSLCKDPAIREYVFVGNSWKWTGNYTHEGGEPLCQISSTDGPVFATAILESDVTLEPDELRYEQDPDEWLDYYRDLQG